MVDEPGGGVSLNRRALHALLKAWPQSSRLLSPRVQAGPDAEDFGRFGQAPDARHYLRVRRAPSPSAPSPTVQGFRHLWL